MEDDSFSVEVFIFMTVLALYVLLSYYIQKLQLVFIHQSTVAIFLGFLTSLIIKLVLPEQEMAFSNDFFFSLLLPPIVFSVGYTIKKPQFFQQLLPIVFFGIISTLLAITLLASLLLLANSLALQMLSVKDVLLLTIALSSTDPVTALPILKVHSNKLNAMVSGESVLNSAVGIILFQTVSGITFSDNLQTTQLVLDILLDFGYVFLCSFLLGMTLGLGLSYIFKKFSSFSEHHIKQTSLILLTGYVVYFLGYFLRLSGIISLFTTAIIFSKYGFNNLSPSSRHGTLLVFDAIRYLFQAFIFAFLGASLLTIELLFSAFIIALLLVLILPIIRFLSVSALPLIFKITRKPFPIVRAQRKLFWYTGLMRGIIAFALSLQIDSQKNTPFLRTVALLVVMTTTVVGTTFLNRFCDWVGIGQLDLITVGEVKSSQREVELTPSTKYGVIGMEVQIEETEKRQKLAAFDDKYMKPLFIRDSPNSSPEKKILQEP